MPLGQLEGQQTLQEDDLWRVTLAKFCRQKGSIVTGPLTDHASNHEVKFGHCLHKPVLTSFVLWNTKGDIFSRVFVHTMKVHPKQH